MFLKRTWRSLSEYVQSELLYASAALQPAPSGQSNPQTEQQRAPSTSFTTPPPDPQLVSHFQQRERVYAFIRVPMSLEKFMLFAVWLCFDTFLNMFTFLPIRLLICAFNFLSRPIGYFFKWKKVSMTPAQRCDLLRGVVIVFCSAVVCQLDISVFYHLIRTQSIIKLYIFYNMLEIAEKLMASVGQDIMDALFITATEQTLLKSRSRYLVLIFHVVLAIIYSCIHTVIFMLQAVTLNVAFNSQNKSLLTVMMSNNFVEIKSNVFRKYSKNNLYQVACADAKERFHLVVMMGIVAARNTAQYQWSLQHLMSLLPDMAIVLMVEVFVDWVKHCFISKFNETSAEVYLELRTSLARHVLTASVVSGGADRQDTVANRTGLSLVPLTCLIIIVSLQVLKFADWNAPDPLFFGLVVFGVFVLKSVLGYCVISSARSIVLQTSSLNNSSLAHSHSGSGRLVGGHHGRSLSVEDVKIESSKLNSWASGMTMYVPVNNTSTIQPSPKPIVVNQNGAAPAKQSKEVDSDQTARNGVLANKTNGHNGVKNSPLFAVKSSCFNELRRTRSIGDLTTIYEAPILLSNGVESAQEGQRLAARKFLYSPTSLTPPSPVIGNGDCCPVKSSKYD